MNKPEVRGQRSGFRGAAWGVLLGLLAGCASTKPSFTDEEWVSNITTGRGCHERGDERRAADAFGRAQARARALDDPEALAVAAVNRAVCLLRVDRAAEAREGIEEALADSRVSAERRLELQAAGARAELALGRWEEARSRAGAVLETNPSALLAAQARLVQAGAALAQLDAPAAEQTLAVLPAAAWARLPPNLQAERAECEARIAAMLESPDGARHWQDEAADLWRRAGRLPEMARARAEAGRQARAAGDLATACDRFRRAAKSLWAQGIQAEAARVLEEGVRCAERLQDEGVGESMAKLLVTFQAELRRKDPGKAEKEHE